MLDRGPCASPIRDDYNASMRDLRDRVICIVGASSGIGRATAIECARAGMRVVAAARRLDRLERLAAEIESQGGRALALDCDVESDSDVRSLPVRCVEHFGRLDAVIANAGYGHEGCIVDLSDEALRRIFEVNFFGTVRVARAAVAHFRQTRGGHLLITSSCLARFTLPYFAAYSATKAAQTQLARSLRLELMAEGIDVSVIHPITTTTEFHDTSADVSGTTRRGVPGHAPRLFVQPPERVARAIVRCLRRPKAEVWTSHITRLVAGAMVAFPAFHDFCTRREMALRRAGVRAAPDAAPQDESPRPAAKPAP